MIEQGANAGGSVARAEMETYVKEPKLEGLASAAFVSVKRQREHTDS